MSDYWNTEDQEEWDNLIQNCEYVYSSFDYLGEIDNIINEELDSWVDTLMFIYNLPEVKK